MSGSINTYTYIQAIAQELRGFAQEFSIPVVTATQTTRSGSQSSDVDMSDVSECIYVNENVTLLDGTIKKIGDINVGDQIISNDEFKTTMYVHHTKPKECIKITLKSGKTIIVSKDHVFPSNNGRLCYNTGLTVGMKLNSI
jgi:hypothetical protein